MKETLRGTSRIVTSFFITSSILLSSCSVPPADNISQGDEVAPSAEDSSSLPKTLPDRELARPFSNPWPTEFSRDDLINSALAQSFDYFDSRSPSSPSKTEVVFQDTVPSEYHAPIRESAEAMVRGFPTLAQEEHYVFAGTSIEWLMEEAASRELSLPENGNGIDQPKIPFEEWGPGAFPEGFASGWAHKNLAWVGVSGSWSETEARYVAGHELFHSLHLSVDNGNQFEVYPDGDPRNRPRWLIEGGANFFSYALMEKTGFREYKSPKLPFGIRSLQEFESWWSSDSAYDYGQKAVEYLVASVGVERYLQIYELMGQGLNFADAFQQAIGLPVSEFYEIFDRYVAGI